MLLGIGYGFKVDLSGLDHDTSGFASKLRFGGSDLFTFNPMHLLKERYVRWAGICFVALMVMSIEPEDHMAGEPFWYHYFVSWVFTAVYWNGAYLIFMTFRKVFPEIRQTGRRLAFTYLVLFVWMTTGGIPVKLLFNIMTWNEILQVSTYVEFMAMNLGIALIIGTGYETVFFFEKWKDAIRQNEALKSQQVRTQFEVLQNQMSPHFLFNSLNTLTALIAENQQTAIDFTQKLSDVYRYILQTKERELVTLDEELQFARDYLFLLKMRYPDNLTAEFEMDDSHLKCHIAPLTLQMLIENAIKHNVISKAHPLHIKVYVNENHSIIVKNNLQKRGVLEKSTKMGLDNIRRRYELLGHRTVDVITTMQHFMVVVPLIRVEEERSPEKVLVS